MVDSVVDPLQEALAGFLGGMSIVSGLGGAQVAPATPVSFRVVPAVSEVHLPIQVPVPSASAVDAITGGLLGSVKVSTLASSVASMFVPLAPKIDVKWWIEDEQGHVVDPGKGVWDLAETGDPTTSGLTQSVLSVLFHLRTHRLDHTLNPVRLYRYRVRARVTATVTLPPPPAFPSVPPLPPLPKAEPSADPTVVSAHLDLPAVPILVPSIGIPVLAVVFNRTYFGSGLRQGDGIGDSDDPMEDRAALIVVPNDSPLPSAESVMAVLKKLQDVLAPVNNLVGTVSGLADLLSFLAGIDMAMVSFALTTARGPLSHLPVGLRRTDGFNGIPDLDDVYFGGGDTWDETVASLIVLGPGPYTYIQDGALQSVPTTVLELYQEDKYTEKKLAETKDKSDTDDVCRIEVGSALVAAIPDIADLSRPIPAISTPGGPAITGRQYKESANLQDVGNNLKPKDYGGKGISSLRWFLQPSGNTWHTVRIGHFARVQWSPNFGFVEGNETNSPGPFTTAACAGVADHLHLVELSAGGQMWHTIRFNNSNWQNYFGLIPGQQGNDPGPFIAVSCASGGSALDVVGLSAVGKMWRTVRYEDTSWMPRYELIPTQKTDQRVFTGVSCARLYDQQDTRDASLHVVGVSVEGQLWYASDSYQDWSTTFDPIAAPPGLIFKAVSLAPSSTSLYAVALSVTGDLWLTIRRLGQTWTGFQRIETDAGPFTTVSCAIVDSGEGAQLNIVCLTLDGQLWLTTRYLDVGKWTPVGLIEQFEKNDPGPFITANCAAIHLDDGFDVFGELHVVALTSPLD